MDNDYFVQGMEAAVARCGEAGIQLPPMDFEIYSKQKKEPTEATGATGATEATGAAEAAGATEATGATEVRRSICLQGECSRG